MHRLTRHLRGLLVALAALAISAGVVFAARRFRAKRPPAAAGDGLDRASEAAGKTCRSDPKRPAAPEADEDEDVDESAPDADEEEEADRRPPRANGPRTTAGSCPRRRRVRRPTSADNHGAYVSEIARGDDGKPEAATAAARGRAAAGGRRQGRARPTGATKAEGPASD